MYKVILSLILSTLLLAGCSSKSKTEQLADVLENGAEMIQKCSTLEDVNEVEQKIQTQINTIAGDDFKPTEEEAKMLEPALTSYYKAFAEKTRELTIKDASDMNQTESSDNAQSQPADETDN